MEPKGGLYIHIPYCRKKCSYCDFYTGGLRIAEWDRYSYAVLKELEQRSNEIAFDTQTLYFGGGTPSLMPQENLIQLIEGLKSFINLENIKEFTLEVNPEDVTERNSDFWKNLGVNRISVGIQSLNDNELKIIGRNHNADKAINALKTLRKNFVNISADLMYGIPSQTLDSYEYSIKSILDYEPKHISSYSLMLEEGTAMTFLNKKGWMVLPDEELWDKMYQMTINCLERAGFKRYEISNFSLPGFESKHNTGYWKGSPYLGLGVGAHSYDGGSIRRYNPNDLKGYVNFYNEEHQNKSRCFFYEEENLTQEEKLEETLMTRLRMTSGLCLNEFEFNFGEKAKKDLLQKSQIYINQGLLKEEHGRIYFSNEGFRLSDMILSNLI